MDEVEITQETAAPAEAPAAAPVAAPAAPTHDWAPEKFRVMGQDGSLDLEATARKIAQGYTNAERLVGADRLPPDDPKAYQFKAPEYLADAPVDDTTLSDFQSKAHALGLTQAQFEGVIAEFYNRVPALLQGHAALKADQAKAALAEAWGTPVEVKRNMDFAERAVATVPESLRAQIKQRYATDPVFWQFAAQFGREVGEDRPPSQDGSSGGLRSSVEELMKTEAYRNPRHPDHQKVSKQVSEFFQARYGEGSAT